MRAKNTDTHKDRAIEIHFYDNRKYIINFHVRDNIVVRFSTATYESDSHVR